MPRIDVRGVCVRTDMSPDSTNVKLRRVLLLTRTRRTTLREAINHKLHVLNYFAKLLVLVSGMGTSRGPHSAAAPGVAEVRVFAREAVDKVSIQSKARLQSATCSCETRLSVVLRQAVMVFV